MENSKIAWTTLAREIPGFPAYRLLPSGVLLTCWSRGGRRRVITDIWRQIVGDVGKKGHRRVTLYTPGKRLRILLHRLMLEVFVGPCPDGMEACHHDGDPSNNSITNLRWDTPQANWQDRRRHGRGNEGESNSAAKLTVADVREMKRLRSAGWTWRQLGERFGVTLQAAHLAATGKNWRCLQEGQVLASPLVAELPLSEALRLGRPLLDVLVDEED